MQKYVKHEISEQDIISKAQEMKERQAQLLMIHGYVDKEGQNVISYDYEVADTVESYTVCGVNELPTISEIYSQAAAWPERELNELMNIDFTGLDTSERLFLPDNMLSGQGNIIVTPMAELIEKNQLPQKED